MLTTNLFDSIQQPLKKVLPLGITLLSACRGEHKKKEKKDMTQFQFDDGLRQ